MIDGHGLKVRDNLWYLDSVFAKLADNYLIFILQKSIKHLSLNLIIGVQSFQILNGNLACKRG